MMRFQFRIVSLKKGLIPNDDIPRISTKAKLQKIIEEERILNNSARKRTKKSNNNIKTLTKSKTRKGNNDAKTTKVNKKISLLR